MTVDEVYRGRPKDEQERLAMVSFHLVEQECDMYNQIMYEMMDKEHLGKMKLKQGIAMSKRWHKDSERALKKLKSKDLRFHSNNEPRHWLNAYIESEISC